MRFPGSDAWQQADWFTIAGSQYIKKTVKAFQFTFSFNENYIKTCSCRGGLNLPNYDFDDVK